MLTYELRLALNSMRRTPTPARLSHTSWPIYSGSSPPPAAIWPFSSPPSPRSCSPFGLTAFNVVLGSGAVLGTALALALGQWLSDHYGEPRLDLACVLAGIVTLCAIGQLAAWHPARRAASVPPSIATRTV